MVLINLFFIFFKIIKLVLQVYFIFFLFAFFQAFSIYKKKQPACLKVEKFRGGDPNRFSAPRVFYHWYTYMLYHILIFIVILTREDNKSMPGVWGRKLEDLYYAGPEVPRFLIFLFDVLVGSKEKTVHLALMYHFHKKMSETDKVRVIYTTEWSIAY